MSGDMALPPHRPYFLRAMHAWISDAGFTPQIIADTRVAGVRLPAGYADESGRIVLNIGPEAVRDLELTNDAVTFNARFGGVACRVHIPAAAILGIYARETGEGIAFGDGDARIPGDQPALDAKSELPSDTSRPPHLKVVK